MNNAAMPSTLEERIAQLLFIRIGSNLPPIRTASEDQERILRLIEKTQVGGLLLFNGQWPDVKATLDQLQSASRFPLLVAADLERGAGQQVHGLAEFPHARAFAESGPNAAEAVRSAGRITAAQALGAGVHVLLGPVADVDSNPRNPIISNRAYSSHPERAGKFVRAFIEGAQELGAVCCAKHFPGHGDTSQDSHETLPSVDRPAAELYDTELSPFRAAIDASVGMVMTAHVSYPSLDSSGDPATVSRPILDGLLRDALGFDGIVCSDSLLMAGIRNRYDSETDAVCSALNAGVDLILDVADPAAVLEGLVERVHSGVLSESRVDDAFERVWSAKTRVMEASHRADNHHIDNADGARLAETVAAAAVRPWGAVATEDELCFDCRSITACVFTPTRIVGDPDEQPLAEELCKRHTDVTYLEVPPEPTAKVRELLRVEGSAEQLLIATVVKPAAWRSFGLSTQQVELVHELLAAQPNAVLVAMGVPSVLESFPEASRRLVTHSDAAVSQAALASRILPQPCNGSGELR